jgi:hypothetical protein
MRFSKKKTNKTKQNKTKHPFFSSFLLIFFFSFFFLSWSQFFLDTLPNRVGGVNLEKMLSDWGSGGFDELEYLLTLCDCDIDGVQ